MILSIGYEWLLPLKFGGQRRHCSTGSFGGVITRPGQDVVEQYTPCKLAVIYFCFTPRRSLQNHWTDTNCFIWKLSQVLHFSIIPFINNCCERLRLVCHSWRTFWLVVARMIFSDSECAHHLCAAVSLWLTCAWVHICTYAHVILANKKP
jgi:hypothetical protein